MNAEIKLQLIRDVYTHVLAYTESFTHDDIGVDLAYFVGAVVDDALVDVYPDHTTPGDMYPLWQLLRLDTVLLSRCTPYLSFVME